MARFVLSALAMMAASLVLFAGALGGLPFLPDLSERVTSAISERAQKPPEPTQQLQEQQQAATTAQTTDHPAAPKPPPQAAAPDTLHDVLLHEIADLQQQASAMQAELARQKQELAQRTRDLDAAQAKAALSDQEQAQRTQQLGQHSRDLAAAQAQVAQREQELTQRGQELDRRTRELEAARAAIAANKAEPARRNGSDTDAVGAETDQPRQDADAARRARQTGEAQPPRPKVQRQQVAANASPPPPAPAPRPVAQPVAASSPPPAPASQPAEPSPGPSPSLGPSPSPGPAATQQLEIARQWLSAGRPDEARRILAMVQTRMVFQPVTPDQPDAQGTSPSATAVGDAIRWLDMGASGQAMQAITHAINRVNGAPPVVRAWSAYRPGQPSGYAPPPNHGFQDSP
jgi:hypothetical protein